MTPRERIFAAIDHKETPVLPVDFGGGNQTGMHVVIVYKLRQILGLDPPGTPVKVVEVGQMLGEIAPDLQSILGIDTVPLRGTKTAFGLSTTSYKEWRLPDGTPVLVPEKFNTEFEPNGDLLQWPQGDRTVPPSGRMPAGGYYFDAIVRQPPLDESRLDPADNTEEFQILPDTEFEHYGRLARQLYETTDKAIFCSFPGLSFGDVALVPGPALKYPRGIRDIEEWYVSLVMRPWYVKAVFEKQTEIALENLERLHKAVGDIPMIIQTNGTDFGTQKGPLINRQQYRELFFPYQKAINDWIHKNTPWKTFMHCCGGVEPLIPDFIEAGFDILNPVQCSAQGMDPVLLKKKYGEAICFWGGGVDTQKTLQFGTPQQVKDEVRRRVEIFSRGGGYVFNTVHNVQPTVPIENVLAMFEAIQEFRRSL